MSQLTDQRSAAFHQRLIAARDAAKSLLRQGAAGEAPPPVSGGAIGRLTRMDAMQMQGMSQLSQGQLKIRLQQIDAAITAYSSGHYGRCNRCKQPIDLARLEALPEAPLCMPCQEAVEG